MADSTPYSTVNALVKAKPGWINPIDAERLAAYKTYDDMYHSNPGTYELMVRGSDDLPIYMPTAKNLINTLARYVGRGFGYAVDQTQGTPAMQKLAVETYGSLFIRERILSTFSRCKKSLLKFGDAFWYIQGDSEKPEGKRLSVKTIDPGLMFVRNHPEDPDRVVGWDMVEQITETDKVMIVRQRWLKNTAPDHPATGQPDAPVWYQKVKMELEGWEGDSPKGLQVINETMFPEGIIELPIYHMKNNEEDSNPYGSSELRSLERVIAAINQAVTDQDIALALAGLGVYATGPGGPTDENGNESSWIIGPGEVIEDPEFKRINGISSISPSLEHIKYLEAAADKAVGITDVTRGQVSADVAASGVALAIRMAPTIDAADEKDLHIKDVFDQFLFDLKAWFKAFESVDVGEAHIYTMFGDKLPGNRQSEIEELLKLLENGVVSVEFVQKELTDRYGFQFPVDMLQQIADRKAADAAAADPYAQRAADTTLDDGTDPADTANLGE